MAEHATGRMTLEELTTLVNKGEIDTVVTCMVDMQGRLVGKRITGPFFLDSVVRETHGCNYLLTVDMDMEPVPGYKAASWEKGYGDFVFKPDISTLRRIPWLPGTALVLCDVLNHHGEEIPFSPRAILKKQVARLTKRKLTAHMASELEFFLFNETYESAHEKDYRNLKTSSWYIEDYHVFQTTKEEPLMRAIRNGLEGAGIPVESSKGEWGPGQEEINIRYADALEMADRHVILKNSIKEIAWLQGHAVTFMAKWHDELAGNSCHIHCSLWDEENRKPLFDDAQKPGSMSDSFRHFLAGQLETTRAMTCFLAPFINSYKRFTSLSFAPTRAVWSFDNRTAGYRVLGREADKRVECRIPGADINPYLAFAALLAGGLHGLQQQLPLEEAFSGDAYAQGGLRELPRTLEEAVTELDTSQILRNALGDDVVEHYLHTARREIQDHASHVTDRELRKGFERG